MSKITRDIFISLSQNKFLGMIAQKWGFKLGAGQFVAGLDTESVLKNVKNLNMHGMAATIDHLGEFITDPSKSITAKENILKLIRRISEENVNCHLSIKLTQLGLDIAEDFCLKNTMEIVKLANRYNLFINIDMEDYTHYEATLRILKAVRKEYDNIGTAIQTYLYRAESDMDKMKNVRLRIVKGAYSESDQVAFKSKKEIDDNFINLTKKRLRGSAFTSIATHDHYIIDEIKQFVEDEQIDKTKFEFQMLYGFRTDMQQSLTDEGYLFCTYLPFGNDWYGYFMRRLAERPQNINLIIKDKLYGDDNKLKKRPLFVGTAFLTILTFLILKSKIKQTHKNE